MTRRTCISSRNGGSSTLLHLLRLAIVDVSQILTEYTGLEIPSEVRIPSKRLSQVSSIVNALREGVNVSDAQLVKSARILINELKRNEKVASPYFRGMYYYLVVSLSRRVNDDLAERLWSAYASSSARADRNVERGIMISMINHSDRETIPHNLRVFCGLLVLNESEQTEWLEWFKGEWTSWAKDQWRNALNYRRVSLPLDRLTAAEVDPRHQYWLRALFFSFVFITAESNNMLIAELKDYLATRQDTYDFTAPLTHSLFLEEMWSCFIEDLLIIPFDQLAAIYERAFTSLANTEVLELVRNLSKVVRMHFSLTHEVDVVRGLVKLIRGFQTRSGGISNILFISFLNKCKHFGDMYTHQGLTIFAKPVDDCAGLRNGLANLSREDVTVKDVYSYLMSWSLFILEAEQHWISIVLKTVDWQKAINGASSVVSLWRRLKLLRCDAESRLVRLCSITEELLLAANTLSINWREHMKLLESIRKFAGSSYSGTPTLAVLDSYINVIQDLRDDTKFLLTLSNMEEGTRAKKAEELTAEIEVNFTTEMNVANTAEIDDVTVETAEQRDRRRRQSHKYFMELKQLSENTMRRRSRSLSRGSGEDTMRRPRRSRSRRSGEVTMRRPSRSHSRGSGEDTMRRRRRSRSRRSGEDTMRRRRRSRSMGLDVIEEL